MPFAGFKDWDACKASGKSDELCGYLKNKLEESTQKHKFVLADDGYCATCHRRAGDRIHEESIEESHNIEQVEDYYLRQAQQALNAAIQAHENESLDYTNMEVMEDLMMQKALSLLSMAYEVHKQENGIQQYGSQQNGSWPPRVTGFEKQDPIYKDLVPDSGFHALAMSESFAIPGSLSNVSIGGKTSQQYLGTAASTFGPPELPKEPALNFRRIPEEAWLPQREQEEDGVWRTVNGRHIFIKDGQSLDDALKSQGVDTKPTKPKTPKTKTKLQPPAPQQINQVTQPGQAVDHTVQVGRYDIEVPEGADEYETVDTFMKQNNLYNKIGKINPNQTHPDGWKIERAMAEHVGEFDEPAGSCYLTTDGKWVGGDQAYGYEEDHRPQMRKALTYAGLDIDEDDPNWTSSDTMIKGLSMSGMIRVGARDTLSLDIYQPLTSAQKTAIQDYVTNHGLSRDDVVLDLNNKMKSMNEDRILNQLVPDYQETTFTHLALQEQEPRKMARYKYNGHEAGEFCQLFHEKVFDLSKNTGRPVLPSESLGYTTQHPNCRCTWEMVDPLYADQVEPYNMVGDQRDHVSSVNRIIGQKARHGTLHLLNSDGTMTDGVVNFNPRMQETISELKSQFRWLTPDYVGRLQQIDSPGRFFLIRAAAETITDHRIEGEQYPRKLDGMELVAMARTAIKKGMDINHDPSLRTPAVVLDSEGDVERGEIQMLVYESDPQIIQAIDNGIITAVSINGGAPRSQELAPCDHNCNGGGQCELCSHPRGVVLGELDDIALTYVVTSPQGFNWKGIHIPRAEPGVKMTKIESL